VYVFRFIQVGAMTNPSLAHCSLALLALLVAALAVLGEDSPREPDYMKREHSLVRPFQGG